MEYRVFHTGDHWVIAVHLGEYCWRVVDRTGDETEARELLGRRLKKAS